mmetsp:Transcript_10289/g.18776  ORF Transcript_10289/g.18776 Transcript_10289/m.18776 type:complete len:221 (-) Transcript_10289:625-1287(-)
MLNLEPRVELEEVKLARFGIEQVFDSSRTLISDRLGQSLRSLFHFTEGIPRGNGRRAFFEDFLESPLSRAVASVEGDSVAVGVSDDLHFEVAGFFAQLHHEHGRSGDFVRNLDKVGSQFIFIGGHTDSLSSSTLGGLKHDWEADSLGSVHSLFDSGDHSLVENIIGNAALSVKVSCETVSRPGNRRHFSRLSQDIGSDFISKKRHHAAVRTNEFDSELVQ